jgi:polysaccharide biosynthesis protein PslG
MNCAPTSIKTGARKNGTLNDETRKIGYNSVMRRKMTFVITILCLFTLALLLQQSTPVEEVPLGPQQHVISINPKIGVHTRLTDEVEPWKIKRTLEMVRQMGASWIVEYFPWAYSEPFPGVYDWGHSDLVIGHARRQGLKVIARLGFTPEWARPAGSTPTELPPENYAAFAEYVYRFTQRYGDQIEAIVIWNEPNLSLEWGFKPVDPVAYTNLLRLCRQRAKAAEPEIKVLGGALAPTLAPPGSELAMDDRAYLEKMLQAGAGTAMDGLAVHAYGWVYPTDSPPDPAVVNFRRVELVRAILAEHGQADMPIYITEAGWNDHPRWSKAVKPAQRIEYTLQAYELAQHWDNVPVVAMWAFRYPWDARNYLDYFTFLTPDFEPKPIYDEVRRYAAGEHPLP